MAASGLRVARGEVANSTFLSVSIAATTSVRIRQLSAMSQLTHIYRDILRELRKSVSYRRLIRKFNLNSSRQWLLEKLTGPWLPTFVQ